MQGEKIGADGGRSKLFDVLSEMFDLKWGRPQTFPARTSSILVEPFELVAVLICPKGRYAGTDTGIGTCNLVC